MPRNRVIYNAQELFIGSLPDEKDPSVIGISGRQILQRINRVQSFSYDINTLHTSQAVLGKSHNVISEYPSPTEITISFSYIGNGANNELRMGLSPITVAPPFKDEKESLFNNFDLLEGISGRNLYLIVNNNAGDVHGDDKVNYPEITKYFTGIKESEVIDPNSKNYGVAVFQNSYLTKYAVKGGVGSLTTVDVDFVSDNFVGYASGSGLQIPYLDFKSGRVINNGTGFIIPNFFNRNSLCDNSKLISEPGNIQLTISRNTTTGIDFLTNEVTDFDINVNLNRENINYIGYKMHSRKPVDFPVLVDFSVNMIYRNDPTGSFTDNLKEKEKYNAVLDLRDDSGVTIVKYTISGAVLESINDQGTIGDNRTVGLKFGTSIDFENHTQGLFMEGKIDSLCEDLQITSENGDSITDENNNPIIWDSVFYPKY